LYKHLAVGAGGTGGALAFTGFHTTWFVVAGVTLVLAGLGIARLFRRKPVV